MALEIEHKFLVANDTWRSQVQKSSLFKQGYLTRDGHCSIRVRLAEGQAWLNIKSATPGTTRLEYDFGIPYQEADALLETLCTKPLIEKTRHYVTYGAHTWEIDEFHGANAGLIVAEIELQSEGEAFERPPWLGVEVTDDLRYYNNQLALNPYCNW